MKAILVILTLMIAVAFCATVALALIPTHFGEVVGGMAIVFVGSAVFGWGVGKSTRL